MSSSQATDSLFLSPPDIPLIRPAGAPHSVFSTFVKPNCSDSHLVMVDLTETSPQNSVPGCTGGLLLGRAWFQIPELRRADHGCRVLR